MIFGNICKCLYFNDINQEGTKPSLSLNCASYKDSGATITPLLLSTATCDKSKDVGSPWKPTMIGGRNFHHLLL